MEIGNKQEGGKFESRYIHSYIKYKWFKYSH